MSDEIKQKSAAKKPDISPEPDAVIVLPGLPVRVAAVVIAAAVAPSGNASQVGLASAERISTDGKLVKVAVRQPDRSQVVYEVELPEEIAFVRVERLN
jgi:hypothetical protein